MSFRASALSKLFTLPLSWQLKIMELPQTSPNIFTMATYGHITYQNAHIVGKDLMRPGSNFGSKF